MKKQREKIEMTTSAIRDEVTKATGVKKQVSEDQQAYLTRLHEAVIDLPSDDWEALSKEAQDWTNAVSDDREANKPIGPFPDEGDTDVSTQTQTASETTETAVKAGLNGTTKAPKKKAAPAAEAKPKKAKAPEAKAKKAAEPKAKAKAKPAKKVNDEERSVSAQTTIKEMLWRNPALSVDEINEKLTEKGLKPPTRLAVASIRSSFRNSCKVIIAKGGAASFPKGFEL